MLEAYLSPTDMIPFYECGDYPFNFGFVGFSNTVTAQDVLESINNLISNVPEGKFPNWVVRVFVLFPSICQFNYTTLLFILKERKKERKKNKESQTEGQVTDIRKE